jgi:hypothetical protein
VPAANSLSVQWTSAGMDYDRYCQRVIAGSGEAGTPRLAAGRAPHRWRLPTRLHWCSLSAKTGHSGDHLAAVCLFHCNRRRLYVRLTE